jgi:hypothetical protein
MRKADTGHNVPEPSLSSRSHRAQQGTGTRAGRGGRLPTAMADTARSRPARDVTALVLAGCLNLIATAEVIAGRIHDDRTLPAVLASLRAARQRLAARG